MRSFLAGILSAEALIQFVQMILRPYSFLRDQNDVASFLALCDVKIVKIVISFYARVVYFRMLWLASLISMHLPNHLVSSNFTMLQCVM
jgi:hypothetical protein